MKPVKLTPVEQAFGPQNGIAMLLPKWEDIPEEFKQFPGTKWNRFFCDLFTFGVTGIEVTAKPGIDADDALIHLITAARSYEPKHEHKEAGFAYLCSLWFDDVKYTRYDAPAWMQEIAKRHGGRA